MHYNNATQQCNPTTQPNNATQQCHPTMPPNNAQQSTYRPRHHRPQIDRGMPPFTGNVQCLLCPQHTHQHIVRCRSTPGSLARRTTRPIPLIVSICFCFLGFFRVLPCVVVRDRHRFQSMPTLVVHCGAWWRATCFLLFFRFRPFFPHRPPPRQCGVVGVQPWRWFLVGGG